MALPPPTDAPLDDAFRAVFSAELSYVCRSLRRCGVRSSDIEDLAHDVFLAAHCRFHEFDRARPIKPWLFGIAFRIASHYRRRAGHQREESRDELEATDPVPLADERLVAAQMRAVVMQALDTLDLDRRAVFVTHDLDEQPMREIAEALGIPIFTAYSRLRSAREQFAVAVKRIQLGRGER